MNKHVEKIFVGLLLLIVIFVSYLLTKYTVDNYNYNLNKSYKVGLTPTPTPLNIPLR